MPILGPAEMANLVAGMPDHHATPAAEPAAAEPASSSTPSSDETPKADAGGGGAGSAAAKPESSIEPVVDDKAAAAIAKAEKRSRDSLAAEKAAWKVERDLEMAEIARLRSGPKSAEDLLVAFKKDPYKFAREHGAVATEEQRKALANAAWADSDAAKTDPKYKIAADASARERDLMARLEAQDKTISELAQRFEGQTAAQQHAQVAQRFLDDTTKSVAPNTHTDSAFKAAPDRVKRELLQLGADMEAEAMREDGATKYRPEFTPKPAAVLAEYEKRLVADFKDRGFTDAEIAARLKPTAPVAAKPVIPAKPPAPTIDPADGSPVRPVDRSKQSEDQKRAEAIKNMPWPSAEN